MPIHICSGSVTIFTAYYPSHGGGMEIASAELARGLANAGFDLRWVAQSDGVLPEIGTGRCIPIRGTDLIYKLSGVPMPLPAPWNVLKIVQVVRDSGLVIVAEANFAISVMAFAIAKLFGKPTLLIQHVGEPSTVSVLARAVMRVGEALAVKPMLRTADEVVFVSDAVARHFEKTRSTTTAHVLGHGVDTEVFFPAANSEIIQSERSALGLPKTGKLACFVGRTTASKGILVIREMAQQRPDWNFAIAGKGSVLPNDWHLKNVFYLGQLDTAKVAGLYRASDACVLPSQSESFSLVVREAISCGCRVVCSEQILETDRGLLPFLETAEVDLSDILGTASRFINAMGEDSCEDRTAGFEYVKETCSWHRANQKYAAIATTLIGKRGLSRDCT